MAGMSGLFIPKHLRKERVAQQGGQRQMSTPIAFWYSKKLDHIMNPPSWIPDPPSGYIKIECRHAHEVELWSGRLRAQEKRIAEMTDEERYLYEDAVRGNAIAEARANVAKMTDPFNKQIAALIVDRMEASREKFAKPSVVEGVMACEKEEGVAS